jgi:D-xylose transport system ATP-binding protein
MSDRAPVLATEGISKSFGGTRALDGVSLDVAAGEIHALCGENGAGKSTLIKILAGLYPHGSYEGRLLRDGREVGFRGVRDAERAGVAVVTQELALVPEMTVAENVFLGHETLAGRFLDGPRMAHETAGWLGRFGLANAFAAPDTPVRALGIGQQQLVEIIRALRKQPKVLILDEPTAALGEAEARRLFAQVRAGARDGMACVYISHRLDEVLDLADRVTVLRDGRAVLTAAARDLDVARLIRAMAGREIRDIYPRTRASAAATPGPVLLEVDGLSAAAARGRAAALHDIRLRIRAGEVLGLA